MVWIAYAQKSLKEAHEHNHFFSAAIHRIIAFKKKILQEVMLLSYNAQCDWKTVRLLTSVEESKDKSNSQWNAQNYFFQRQSLFKSLFLAIHMPFNQTEGWWNLLNNYSLTSCPTLSLSYPKQLRKEHLVLCVIKSCKIRCNLYL